MQRLSILMAIIVLTGAAPNASGSLEVSLRHNDIEMLVGSPYTGTVSIRDAAGAAYRTACRWTLYDGCIYYEVVTPSMRRIEVSGSATGVSVNWAHNVGIVVEAGHTLCIPVCIAAINGELIFDETGRYTIRLMMSSEGEKPQPVAEDAVEVGRSGRGYANYRTVVIGLGRNIIEPCRWAVVSEERMVAGRHALGESSDYVNSLNVLYAYQVGRKNIRRFVHWVQGYYGDDMPQREADEGLRAEIAIGLQAALRAGINVSFWQSCDRAYRAASKTGKRPPIEQVVWGL